MDIPIKNIRVTDWNPRQDFNQDDLNELKASIEEYGILEPLIVRPYCSLNSGLIIDNKYELVAGERRYRAAVELKLKVVPVVIKDLTDSQVHEVMLIENLQRSQLQPLEEAQSLEVLLQEDITQEQLASKLGKSQSWVANRLRLLSVPELLKELLISREITPKHVIALLPFVEYQVFDYIMKRYKENYYSYSVSALTDMIRDCIIYNTRDVLEIDCLPWEYREYDIDISVCEGCANLYDRSDGDIKHRYCLDRDCWKEMVQEAEDAHKSKCENAVKDGVVDVMSSDAFVHLRWEKFDKSDCKTCDNCKRDSNDQCVCMNQTCREEKVLVYEHERDKAILVEQKRVSDAIVKWTAGKAALLNDDLRLVMRALMSGMWDDHVDEAFLPWYEHDEGFDEEFMDDFVNSVKILISTSESPI